MNAQKEKAANCTDTDVEWKGFCRESRDLKFVLISGTGFVGKELCTYLLSYFIILFFFLRK